MCSIPGRGTKIPHSVWHNNKKTPHFQPPLLSQWRVSFKTTRDGLGCPSSESPVGITQVKYDLLPTEEQEKKVMTGQLTNPTGNFEM